MSTIIYAALMVLAIGLTTSMSLLALVHILIAVPCFYFINKTNFKEMPKSSWGLLGLSVAIIISILFNASIMVNGLVPIFKVKYFLFGFFMIAPLSWYFKYHFEVKKIKYLLYFFCIASLVAGVAGTIGMMTGFNPVSMKIVNVHRNAGLFGMLLNYAHNLAFLQIIVFGLMLSAKEVEKFINKKFLYAVFIFNLFALYTTYSRGAILALLVAIPFYFIRSKKFFVLAMGFILLGGLIVFKINENDFSRGASDVVRKNMWKGAIAAFMERPILGYGYLNFEPHSKDIKIRNHIDNGMITGHAHNGHLEILATTGVVGAFFYLAWVLCWFVEMYKRNDLIGRIGIAFIITYIVGGLTQSTIGLGINLFFILGGYSISQINPKIIKSISAKEG